eukprot:Rhum_TRINITY_DN5378_c0_g1::Rhum_TRINITY_DN5378_c0_g1_i1::g.17254::m.17254
MLLEVEAGEVLEVRLQTLVLRVAARLRAVVGARDGPVHLRRPHRDVLVHDARQHPVDVPRLRRRRRRRVVPHVEQRLLLRVLLERVLARRRVRNVAVAEVLLHQAARRTPRPVLRQRLHVATAGHRALPLPSLARLEPLLLLFVHRVLLHPTVVPLVERDGAVDVCRRQPRGGKNALRGLDSVFGDREELGVVSDAVQPRLQVAKEVPVHLHLRLRHQLAALGLCFGDGGGDEGEALRLRQRGDGGVEAHLLDEAGGRQDGFDLAVRLAAHNLHVIEALLVLVLHRVHKTEHLLLRLVRHHLVEVRRQRTVHAHQHTLVVLHRRLLCATPPLPSARPLARFPSVRVTNEVQIL